MSFKINKYINTNNLFYKILYMPSKSRKNKKTKKKRIKNKIYKEYGPGLRYLIYDGNKHVFKFVKKKDHLKNKQ